MLNVMVVVVKRNMEYKLSDGGILASEKMIVIVAVNGSRRTPAGERRRINQIRGEWRCGVNAYASGRLWGNIVMAAVTVGVQKRWWRQCFYRSLTIFIHCHHFLKSFALRPSLSLFMVFCIFVGSDEYG